MGKPIKITYSNGEEDEFMVNEDLNDRLLEEALAKLELQVMDDIFGDLDDEDSDLKKL